MVVLSAQSLACDKDEIRSILVQFKSKQLRSLEVRPGVSREDLSYNFEERVADEAVDWLHRSCRQAANSDTKDGSGSLTLLLVHVEPWRSLAVDVPIPLLADALDLLNISPHVYTTRDIIQAHFFPPDYEVHSGRPSLNRDVCRGCVVGQGSGVAWNHFAPSSSTVGVVWYYDEEDWAAAAYVLSHLIRYRQLSFNHMLIPLLVLQAQLILLEPYVKHQQETICEAQKTSGFHRYARMQSGVVSNHVDLGSLSAIVSGTAANLTTSRDCLQGMLDLAASIKDENESWYTTRTVTEANTTAYLFIRDHTVFWEKECKALLQFAQGWDHKATIVVQGLFNLIAQRDQNASLVIAKESKRDSTAMKSIAAVTMVFLPGTFIASLLAMPLFEMDASSQTLISHQMWLYWAITVPLTLLTLFIWLVWDHVSTSRWAAKQPHLNKVD